MGFHDGHRQRMRERKTEGGLGSFADHELLELLLYYAIPRRDTNALAHRLKDRFGSLSGVFFASEEELRKVEGMGPHAAALFPLLQELGQRIYCQRMKDAVLEGTECIGSYLMNRMCGERREQLFQLCLDAKGKLLRCCRLSCGTATATPVNVREVVENALQCSASRVVLGHNHPSGIALPSAEDRLLTHQIQRALAAMDIRLVDHIVVADGDFVSMADSGMLL